MIWERWRRVYCLFYTDKQNDHRVTTCKDIIHICQNNPHFPSGFTAAVESLVFHYQPERKCQSRVQWTKSSMRTKVFTSKCQGSKWYWPLYTKNLIHKKICSWKEKWKRQTVNSKCRYWKDHLSVFFRIEAGILKGDSCVLCMTLPLFILSWKWRTSWWTVAWCKPAPDCIHLTLCQLNSSIPWSKNCPQKNISALQGC
jgi:hypothetical protein